MCKGSLPFGADAGVPGTGPSSRSVQMDRRRMSFAVEVFLCSFRDLLNEAVASRCVEWFQPRPGRDDLERPVGALWGDDCAGEIWGHAPTRILL